MIKVSTKLKLALKSILSLKMGEIATDKATLVWDSEEDLAEGMEVYTKGENDEVVPAEDGDYTTEDGKVITVVEGKVSAIKDPEAEVAPEAMADEVDKPEADPVEAPEEPEAPKDEDRIAAVEAKVDEITASIEQFLNAVAAIEDRIAAVEEKVAKAENEPAADPAEAPEIEETEAHKSRMSYLRRK